MQKTPHFSVCFTLDVSVDVDHKAELDNAVSSLVDGRCIFIKGRESFKEYFLLSAPSMRRNGQECLEGLSRIPWRAVTGLTLSHRL